MKKLVDPEDGGWCWMIEGDENTPTVWMSDDFLQKFIEHPEFKKLDDKQEGEVENE